MINNSNNKWGGCSATISTAVAGLIRANEVCPYIDTFYEALFAVAG